jgi:hypothetical protein
MKEFPPTASAGFFLVRSYKTLSNNNVQAKPKKPDNVLVRVQARSICGTVNPENREITQNPESLGNEKHILPQQTANPTITGLSPDEASMGAKIEEAVTAATVAEP